MLKNNLNKFLGLAICFTLGVLAGFHLLVFLLGSYSFSNQVAFEIDPLNALSVLVNVLLVVFVTRTLTRQNEEERVEKDLLIKRLEGFQDTLNKALIAFLSKENLKLTDVTAELKTLRRDFNSIWDLLKKYRYEIVVDGCNLCSDIDSGLRDIKDYFTDTPRTEDTGDGAATISQDEISLSASGRQGVEDSNMKIKGQIFDLVVAINKKR